jgi:hypothetical protein
MILPRCPYQKRNRNGNHLRPQPKIDPTKSESSPSERLRRLLSQRLSPNTSSVRGKVASVEGPRSLTRMPSASTKLLRAKVHLLRPISWPVGRKPPLIPKQKRLAYLTEKPQAPHAIIFGQVDCWTCGQKGHYSGDCPSNTKRKSLLSENKPFRSLLAKQAFTPAQTQAAIRIMDTYNQSVCHNCLTHGCRGHNCNACLLTTVKFMRPYPVLWLCFMKIRSYSRVCSMLRQIALLQPSSHPSRLIRTSRWLETPASTPMPTIRNQRNTVTTT